jgi:hypothetical protein
MGLREILYKIFNFFFEDDYELSEIKGNVHVQNKEIAESQQNPFSKIELIPSNSKSPAQINNSKKSINPNDNHSYPIQKMMIVTAWNNGKNLNSGAGYGVKINARDRDTFFEGLDQIELEIPGEPVPVLINNKKKSFWGSTCRELIHKKIGICLINNKLAPWPNGKPPKLSLIKISRNKFRLKL